jgi:hypothetical protein
VTGPCNASPVRALVLAVVLLATVRAHADIGATLTHDAERAQIRAVFSGIRPMPLDQFVLRAPDGSTAKAAKIEPVVEPIAIALVYSGWEIWIGNDELDVMPPRNAGALKYLASALDDAPFASAAPPGSQLVAIEYSQGARVMAKLQPLDKLGGAALGKQADYRDRMANELSAGLERAIQELAASKAPRKAIIVVGDGSDSSADGASARLAELARRADAAGITTREAILLRSPMSSSAHVISAFAKDPIQIYAAEGLRAALARLARRLEDPRLAVVFDASGLTLDERGRIELLVGTERLARELFAAGDPRPPEPDAPWWHAPWRWAVIGGGVALLGLLLALLLRIRAAAYR